MRFDSSSQTFGKQNLWLFYIVLALLIISTIHSCLAFATVYFWLVTSFGDVATLQYAPVSWAVEPVLSGITAAATQLFFAQRIYLLSNRSWIIPGVIVICGLVEIGFSFASCAMVFVLNKYVIAKYCSTLR
jgi:hypothetical protein